MIGHHRGVADHTAGGADHRLTRPGLRRTIPSGPSPLRVRADRQTFDLPIGSTANEQHNMPGAAPHASRRHPKRTARLAPARPISRSRTRSCAPRRCTCPNGVQQRLGERNARFGRWELPVRNGVDTSSEASPRDQFGSVVGFHSVRTANVEDSRHWEMARGGRRTSVLGRISICVAAAITAVGTVLVPTGAGVAAASGGHVDPSTATARTGALAHARQAAHAASNIQAVPVRSSYESTTRVVYRDIGLSVVLPDGHELWIFGDTNVLQHTSQGWTSQHFIDGSSALEAHYTRGQVPHGGEYPTGTPGQFLPSPKHVYLPDGSGRACIKGTGDAAFPARWPTGIVVMPNDSSDVLITYAVVCVYHPPGAPQAQNEGWGYALYNWRHQFFDHGPVDVFKPSTAGGLFPSSSVLGSPVFENGQLTFFSSTCSADYLGFCGAGQAYSVTMSPTIAALSNPSSYQVRPIGTDGSASWEPLSVSVGRYSNGLRLIEWTTIGGTYAIFSASSVGKPWHLDHTGTLPGCQSNNGFCFALNGHPELSTPTKVFVSYVDPNVAPTGHVVISAVPG
jgi:hypothetical protein